MASSNMAELRSPFEGHTIILIDSAGPLGLVMAQGNNPLKFPPVVTVRVFEGGNVYASVDSLSLFL